jgi:hypothetical protein
MNISHIFIANFLKNNSNYIWSFLKLFNTKYTYNAFQSIHLGVEIILTWAFSRKHIIKKKKKKNLNGMKI